MSTWSTAIVDGRVHVVPDDDLKPHVQHIRCWCKPVQDDEEPLVWSHNSMDRREDYETGKVRPQ